MHPAPTPAPTRPPGATASASPPGRPAHPVHRDRLPPAPAPVTLTPSTGILPHQPCLETNAIVRRDDFFQQLPTGPGLPALNSHLDIYWDAINPQPGVYNWSRIEAALSRLENQTVTLADGQTAPRLIWLTLPVFWTQGSGVAPKGQCNNNAPNWVPYRAVVNPNNNTTQRVPAVEAPAFRNAYRAVMLAAGQRWGNHRASRASSLPVVMTTKRSCRETLRHGWQYTAGRVGSGDA
ncbi:MAG: hypothetical protein HZY76_09985 [Anaerolineae bacterium]|nr:MAG: hypothetical protein HZY76_09985 [Anaerolineae bacterium]